MFVSAGCLNFVVEEVRKEEVKYIHKVIFRTSPVQISCNCVLTQEDCEHLGTILTYICGRITNIPVHGYTITSPVIIETKCLQG